MRFEILFFSCTSCTLIAQQPHGASGYCARQRRRVMTPSSQKFLSGCSGNCKQTNTARVYGLRVRVWQELSLDVEVEGTCHITEFRRYPLGPVSANIFCKGSDHKYFWLLGLLAETIQPCCCNLRSTVSTSMSKRGCVPTTLYL